MTAARKPPEPVRLPDDIWGSASGIQGRVVSRAGESMIVEPDRGLMHGACFEVYKADRSLPLNHRKADSGSKVFNLYSRILEKSSQGWLLS